MSIVTIDSVLSVVARADVEGVRLVGIDGPSGSGKSTVAGRLAAAAGAPVIACDDFVSWGDVAGWWPRFEDEVLEPLLAGRDARYEVRDWRHDEFGSSLDGETTVPWAPTVVIEGVTCTRASVSRRLAYRVWVEAPATVRLERGIARDGESHRALWQRWMEQEHRFFATDGTRDRADIRVDGAPRNACDPERELVLIDA